MVLICVCVCVCLFELIADGFGTHFLVVWLNRLCSTDSVQQKQSLLEMQYSYYCV